MPASVTQRLPTSADCGFDSRIGGAFAQRDFQHQQARLHGGERRAQLVQRLVREAPFPLEGIAHAREQAGIEASLALDSAQPRACDWPGGLTRCVRQSR